jgi:hypothetical protein
MEFERVEGGNEFASAILERATDGGGAFDATVKWPRYRSKSDGRGCREAWAPPPHTTPVT